MIIDSGDSIQEIILINILDRGKENIGERMIIFSLMAISMGYLINQSWFAWRNKWNPRFSTFFTKVFHSFNWYKRPEQKQYSQQCRKYQEIDYFLHVKQIFWHLSAFHVVKVDEIHPCWMNYWFLVSIFKLKIGQDVMFNNGWNIWNLKVSSFKTKW